MQKTIMHDSDINDYVQDHLLGLNSPGESGFQFWTCHVDVDLDKHPIDNTGNHYPVQDAWTSYDEIWQHFIRKWGVAGTWIWPSEDDLMEAKRANYRIMRAIFDKYLPMAYEMYLTTQYEYNPIENYDRHERRDDYLKDTKAGQTYADATDKPTSTTTRTPTNWTTTQNYDPTPVSTTQTTSNSGYANSSALQPTQSTTTSHTKTGGSNGEVTTTQQTGTLQDQTVTAGKSHDDYTVDHTGHQDTHVHGNIGVMSTQQMIEQERNIIINVLDWFVEKMGDAVDFRENLPFYEG